MEKLSGINLILQLDTSFLNYFFIDQKRNWNNNCVQIRKMSKISSPSNKIIFDNKSKPILHTHEFWLEYGGSEWW
jgi:hypothetical protein